MDAEFITNMRIRCLSPAWPSNDKPIPENVIVEATFNEQQYQATLLLSPKYV